LPDISAQLYDFVRLAAKTDFVINPRTMQMNSQLWNWLSAKKIIRQVANVADKVICSGCERYCYMDVESTITHEGKAAYFIACDKRDDIGFMTLDSNEVRPHNFNMLVFCDLIANKLNSHDVVATLIPDKLFKVGRCTLQDKGYTLFLVTSLDENEVLQHHEYKKASNPVVILLDKKPDSSLPIVSLDSLIFVDSSGNVGIFLEAITSLYKDEVDLDKNIFRKEGNSWLVVYKGKQTNVTHSKGMFYIKELLCNPNKDIRAIDLQAGVDKGDLPDEQYSSMSHEELESEGLAVHVESPDDMIDSELLATYRTNLKTIDTDIAESESKGLTTKASQLKKQKAGMEEFIRKNTNIKGKSRKVPDTSERARQAVNRAINTAIKNIGNELLELSLHLNSHIETGRTCKYKPEENLKWQL